MRRGGGASNAASLSCAAWRSITWWQFLGYGPVLSVSAGSAGPGRAYRPRPVSGRVDRLDSPGPPVHRNQAITAIVLSERLATGYGEDDPFVLGWRDELGL